MDLLKKLTELEGQHDGVMDESEFLNQNNNVQMAFSQYQIKKNCMIS